MQKREISREVGISVLRGRQGEQSSKTENSGLEGKRKRKRKQGKRLKGK